ncbi:hypothetical protein D8M15_00640 [Micrococcus sp. HSID17228]|uniref:hypothetical protein n=1 Tax=Micrococcus TaxID=1269 RepID=UPI000DB4FA58|nr:MULTISPECIES: hypothetical protein [Micrococcus]PZP23908.1 MAG: hypothetical protein DI613_17565 [Kocuria rhizophila]MPZ02462.1 hypothetical protein [Micrococcus luteus]QGY82449.1 hypothetical protein F1717_00530 [Micrococcus luteus]RUQ43747.1 hypothetical protein D8M29_01480 [Micrococcus sp. HSID17227]RUQ45967.1 hypothetical protein D8M15_00640 [Micrococcus sp. HSID17228]
MIRTILAQLSAVASIVLTVLLAGSLRELLMTPWKVILVVVVVAVAISLALWEVITAVRSRPIAYKGKKRNERIQKYMANLTRFDGQCVVSSNDLSWVSGEAYEMLMKKAAERSLVLVMPRENEMSRELVAAGAEARYYGDETFRLRSRFTVVNSNRADAWVAVGYGRKGAHMIREFHSSDDPTLNMAKDLIDMARRLAEKGAR